MAHWLRLQVLMHAETMVSRALTLENWLLYQIDNFCHSIFSETSLKSFSVRSLFDNCLITIMTTIQLTDKLAEVFYVANYWSPIITSKNSSEILSNHNKHLCFFCLQDKMWIEMPKWTIFLCHQMCLFWLLRISDVIFDVIIGDH